MSDWMTSIGQAQPELRRLWSDPRLLVILMTLRRGGGPLYARQLARQLGDHHETVTEKLRALRAMGMVTRSGVRSGWTLTACGMLFFEADGFQGISAAKLPVEAGAVENPRTGRVDAAEKPRERSHPRITRMDANGAENPRDRRHSQITQMDANEAENPRAGLANEADSGENPHLESLKSLEEESINSLDSLDSSSNLSDLDLLDAEGENSISMADLLTNSGLLFGEPGVLRAHLPEQPREVVLSWLAQGYVQRHSLRNPAGLVYRRLQRGEKPLRCYLEQPEKYLPPAYLEAIGWVRADPLEAQDASRPDEEEDEQQVDQTQRMRKLVAIMWVLGLSLRGVSVMLTAFRVKVSHMTVWRDMQEQAMWLEKHRRW